MKLLFTGDINFRGKDNVTFEESEKILKEIYNSLEKYNASGNFNLVSCEAHLSQLKEVLWTLHNEETEIAEEWAEKIKELEKMPL